MPIGTFAVNPAQTFSTALLMSCAPKIVFQGTEQDRNAAGLLKWAAEVAVTFLAEPGQRPQSDVISVTIAAERDPAASLNPGTPVELVDLRLGISAPEAREGGKVRGGRPYFQAGSLRPSPAHAARKPEAA